LADGTPVTTAGGAGGLFTAAYIDEENNVAVFEFLNGEKLEIELRSDLYINFVGEALESADFRYGETRTFEMEAVGVKNAVVTTPDEWNSSFDKETGVWSITAPAEEHASCADVEGEVALIYFGDENQSSVITLNVAIGEYVDVAEEYLTIEAAAAESTFEVPFTADGEVTIEAVDTWISGVLGEGVVTLTVAANPGIERTGTIKLVAKSNEVVITVNQGKEVELQPYGYRAGSETILFGKSVAEIEGLGVDAMVEHMAVTKDYVILAVPYQTPVVLDALTADYVGTLDLGELAGLNAAITADDAGNIIISTYQEADGFRVARMASINDTPEVFITHSSTDYGKDISVVGDVYGDAIVTMMYSPWCSGTTGHLRFLVSNGVSDTGYWSNFTAAEGVTAKIDNNNGDVIFRSADVNEPYFMSGYSGDVFVWVENGVAYDAQLSVASGNEWMLGSVCLDVENFNGAYYLMTAADTYFAYGTSHAAIIDATSRETFAQGAMIYTTSDYGWSAINAGGGSTDCALKVSEDGVYMYAYVVYAKGSVGCIRVDCLANAPAEE
jgi:hypothetical protein